MSDEFLKVASLEITMELNKLDRVISWCKEDRHVLKNSSRLRDPLHKIRGLAPMIGQENIGEIAKTCEEMVKYVINNGILPGCCDILTDGVSKMKRTLAGTIKCGPDDFSDTVRARYPQIPNL